MVKLDRRTFLQGAASMAAFAKLPSKQRKRPNFLILYPDQWRYDWMEGTVGLPIQLPNIARIAKKGMNLATTIVASPLCAPSRACLASGKEYDDCRTPGTPYDYPLDQVTYYKLLRDSGYHVLGCGKIDLHKGTLDWGPDGKRCLPEWGFSDGIDNEGKMDAVWSSHDHNIFGPYMTFLKKQGLAKTHVDDLVKRYKQGYAATYPTPLPDPAYCDNWITGNALGLLGSAPSDKPWHLVVNFTGPHNPEDITERMEKTCRSRQMPHPNGSTQYDAATHTLIRQNYTAMCENIDAQIGFLLAEVEKRGDLDNTVIIFSSDHGEMLGDHDRWAKSVPYEASVHVPLIVAGPGVHPGRVSHALINHIDIGATILDFAGVKDTLSLPRKSFRNVLEGKTEKHRDVVRSGLGSWRIVRDERYKLIVGFDPKIGIHTQGGHDANSNPTDAQGLHEARKRPDRVSTFDQYF
ncbi:MAG: sulfatase-like hydrolase/transferase [Acidobacteria bacterium]|nr:sulfatase-like hydrolase/transferase [Acidobacteriota bacterium]